jgi:hypothetical protein
MSPEEQPQLKDLDEEETEREEDDGEPWAKTSSGDADDIVEASDE